MITFDLTDITIEELLNEEPEALALCTPMRSVTAVPILPIRTCPVAPKLAWTWKHVGVSAELGACRITVQGRSQVLPFQEGAVMLSPTDSIEIFCNLAEVHG